MEIKVWRVFRKRQTVLSLTFVLIVVFLLYLLQTGTLKFKSEGNSLDVEQKVELNLNELDEDEEIKIFGEFDENEVRIILFKANHLSCQTHLVKPKLQFQVVNDAYI